MLISEKVKNKFLQRIQEKIEADPKLTPLKKRELWIATKKSYSPVLFTLLWGLQGAVEVLHYRTVPISMISWARTYILGRMMQDAYGSAN